MSQRRLWVFILLKNDEHTLCGYVVRAYSAFFDLSQETVPRTLSFLAFVSLVSGISSVEEYIQWYSMHILRYSRYF